MNKHTVNLLVDAFPQYADEQQLLQLPEGWLHAINELFCDLRDVQKLDPGHHPLDAIRPYVDVQWLLVDGRWSVYVRTLEPALRWTDQQAHKLVEAIERFQDASEEADGQ
ncbi:hypothetical protein E0J16_34100 [Rhizobium pisi]|uniref:hypothetical protein n=1 Tax=Rhizobium pisi TaxID=574561 RepID=UPI00103D314C|nr:hypothetical protein [Rhizobium pisi]TCA41723.1 hypothetical protein E0J16_34100 [Rhizobium pisi]